MGLYGEDGWGRSLWRGGTWNLKEMKSWPHARMQELRRDLSLLASKPHGFSTTHLCSELKSRESLFGKLENWFFWDWYSRAVVLNRWRCPQEMFANIRWYFQLSQVGVESAVGVLWVETMDAAQHPTRYKMAPRSENYLAQNASSAEVQNYELSELHSCILDLFITLINIYHQLSPWFFSLLLF